MGNTANFMPDFETIKLPLAIPGKPNLQAIYGPWNDKEEAREALEWFNTTRDPEGTPITEIPAGSTVAIYDDQDAHTSVTEYWWKDGNLVLKSNNNSMIYTIVTDYDFIVYNDVIPTPELLRVKRINYGLNNISDDVNLGKLAYRIDEGEWNYVNHSTHEDEKVIYDDTNKCFVFYLNTLRPLTLVLFRWYTTHDDGSINELLAIKNLLVTATSNDVLELFFQTDEILSLELVDTNSISGSEFVIPSDYDTNPKWAAYYNAYLKNNHLKLKTGGKEWVDLMPQYSTDNQFNYVYKITRERKYGRWLPFNGPELVFIKGMDGSIKYEEVFYVTDQFGSLNLIATSDFNNAYEYNKETYDLADEFIINSGIKSEQWSRTCKEVSASNLYRYARKRFLNSEGKYSVDWSYPYLHATYKPSDSYENIYKKAKKGLEEALGTEISDINTYLREHPDAKFSDLPLEELRGWSYSAESLEESGDIICLAYRGFSEDTVSYYQGPFIIGSYGENGLDGGNVEYIYKSSNQGTVQGFIDSVIGDFGSWNEFAESLLNKTDEHDRPYQGGIDGEYVIDGWSDDCPVRDAVKPYIYMIHRKYSGVDKLWGLYSEPKLWDKFIAYELVVSNKTPQIPSRYEGYSTLAAKNATMTTIKLFAGGDLIESGYTLSWSKDVYTTDGEGNYWMDDGIEKGSGCIVQKDEPYNITVTASYNGVEVASQTIYITRQDTDAYQLHINPNVRIYLGDNDYSVDNYELYVTKLDVDGNYSKDTSSQYLLVLDDVGAEHGSTIMKYDASNPLGQQTAINNFINNPEYISNDLMLYLYHWESRFDGQTDNWIKSHLGERLDVTLINTINASDVIDNIDGNYQITLNYDTLNIPSSKIGNENWFEKHKIHARVIHNGQINIGRISAHIDLVDSAEQIDNYIIDEQGNKVHEVESYNGLLNILISQDINSDAILTIDAEVVYNRGSEYGTYTLTKNIPVHISTEAEVLNLYDNVGVLYADNLGEFGIEKVEFTVYDEVKLLEYTGRDILIIISCSEQTLSLITTKAVWDLNKLCLYLDSEYTGRNKIRQSQASFMKVILEYLSNLDNGNKVSIICSLVKNNIEKSRQIIEIDFTAVKQSGIDIDMKNDSITLPIGWNSNSYNSVANIDCNIHINTNNINNLPGYSYAINVMSPRTVNIHQDDLDNNKKSDYYISDFSELGLGQQIIVLKITITHTVGEGENTSSKTYEILKLVSLNITNKDFYYLEFTTKALNSVIDSSEITQNVYYDIYKYENGKSIKLSGNQVNLWISVSNTFDTNVSYNNPDWNTSKNTYVIKNIPILYNITDYTFTLATLEDGNYVILDYVELPVIYYGKSDRRVYYLMLLLKGYLLSSLPITYNTSYNLIDAIHNYYNNANQNLYDRYTYYQDDLYQTKRISSIIFNTTSYHFSSTATTHESADVCGYVTIDNKKRSIRYYKHSGVEFMYCKYDDSLDESYYFYVYYNSGDKTKWNPVSDDGAGSAFLKDIVISPYNSVRDCYIYDSPAMDYNEWIGKDYACVIDVVPNGDNTFSYVVNKIVAGDQYNSLTPILNLYVCLLAVRDNAIGISPLSPYEFYAIQLMEGTEYGKFGNIIINSSLGLDGYGRRYIYLKTNKIIEDIDNYYLNQEELSRNINNCLDFLNDEFVPDIRDGNDIWSDNILEPDVYQKYVYEFSDKKVNNIWQPFTSFILRSHFDSVFQFSNDNNNIIIDNDALDDDVKEITKTRFSFFDGEVNNKLYIIGVSDDSRNVYVSTSKTGNAEYTISLDYSGLLITLLSYDTDTLEFIQYTLGRTEGKFIASKFLLTYSIYKYASEDPHHGELMAISNLNIVVKDFNSGEIYKIITNPTQIGVRAIDNTGTSYVLEDLHKSGGSISNLNLYFYAYSNGNITSLIRNNELDEDFYFTIDGVQCGLNLFDRCVYEELPEYNEKHIKDIIFKTDQYSFTSQASSRLTAEKCGSIIIDGIKRDIKYYRSGNFRYLYCAYGDSGDSYYFYVQRDGNDYKQWEHVTGSEFLGIIVPFTTLGNGFISDGIVFEPSSEGDHFEIKIKDIFKDTALPNLINLFYKGGDFILNPTIVDSLTISYVKAGLPGDDVLPMVKYTVEPLNSVFLVDEDGKYSNSDLQLVYHIIAEYGIDKKAITGCLVDSVTINGTGIPNQSTEAYYEYGLDGDEFTITIRKYNTLQSLFLKLDIRINCSFTCIYDEGKEYSRIVSMFATPISSSSPNITYEFVPNTTSISQVWSYGSSYYDPNILKGTLYRLIGDKRRALTLEDGGNIKNENTKIGDFLWEIIKSSGTSIYKRPQISHLQDLLDNENCSSIRFKYTITYSSSDSQSFVYTIPVHNGQLQEYFISVKGTANGSMPGSTAALSKISLLEGTSIIDNISTSSEDPEEIILAIFDTSNKLSRKNDTIYIYSLSQLTDLRNVLNTSYKDSKYIVCLASYKQINLTSDLYTLLLQFGLGDLKYVQIGNNAAMTPFAFIGCYGLAKGKACYQEAQALITASSVEISAKIVDGTLDFSKTGEDGENGQDAVRIDIDNQQDAISIKSGKVRFAKEVVVKARIYKGASVVTNGISIDMSSENLQIGTRTPSIEGLNGIVSIKWPFSTDDTVSIGSYTKTIKLIYNGIAYEQQFTLVANDTPVIYQLLPSKNEIAFSVNASNEYTPETQKISFGYTSNDGTVTTYPGTTKNNTCTEGGAPYNMFYRYINADGTIFDHWYWVKDIPNSTDFTGELVIPYNTTFSAIEVVLSSALSYLDVDDSNIVDKEVIPIIKSGKKGTDGKDGLDGSNGYPGCITRMFKTNVVAGKTYYNQTKSNPNDETKVPDGVCKLDYMIVYTNQKYYAFVCKLTHSVELDGLQPAVPNPFITVTTEQGQEYVLINNYYVVPGSVKNPDGTSHDDVLSCQELWQQVSNMDGSAFFTSFTAVSGYIETLSGSAILLTDDDNINAGFRSSRGLSDGDVVLWSGSELPKGSTITGDAVSASANNATFRVTKDGTLYAKRGMFEGSVVSVPTTQNLWVPLGNRMNLWLQTYDNLIDSAKNFNRDRFVSRGFDYTSWGAESVKIKGLQIISTNSNFIPVVGTGSMTAINKVHDINSGLSCVIQHEPNSTENILIDLPCYTDKFNIRYDSNEGYYPITTIKSSTNNIPDENFTLVYNYDTWSTEESRLSPIECLEFSINPTLVNKGINMWLNDKLFELEDIDEIAATNEMLYRLWVESFIDKEFTLIISTEENGSEVLPPDNIFIRGIKRNILHENEEINPYEDHPYFNIYPEGMIKCQDLIMGKALPKPGEYIDVSYFSNTYPNDEYYSYPNGNTIYPYYTGSLHGNMLIIMKFKCKSLYGKAEYARRPSSPSESLYTKEFDYYDIYWDLERYDIVSSPDINLITIKNDIKYF